MGFFSFMEQGYIRLWRKINENKFLEHDNNAYIVFIKLLTFVNYKTGSYDTGRFKLAELTNLNPNTLYKVLVRLEDNGLITLSSNNKYTTISICNWTTYQQDGNTTSNNTVTTREQPGNTKQELIINNNISKGLKISDYPELEPELRAFIEMRKALRKPVTATALKLIVSKLGKLYPNNYEMQKVSLNQSVENSWQTVYEVKHLSLPNARRFA